MINIDGVTKDDVNVPEGELGEQLEAAFEKGDDVRREGEAMTLGLTFSFRRLSSPSSPPWELSKPCPTRKDRYVAIPLILPELS